MRGRRWGDGDWGRREKDENGMERERDGMKRDEEVAVW